MPPTAAEAAPQATLQKSDGWSFKPRGRLMIDAGTISVPDGVDADDGFGSEARRARLGASGDLPGGFGYKFEFDLADDDIDVNDAILTYEPATSKSPSASTTTSSRWKS